MNYDANVLHVILAWDLQHFLKQFTGTDGGQQKGTILFTLQISHQLFLTYEVPVCLPNTSQSSDKSQAPDHLKFRGKDDRHRPPVRRSQESQGRRTLQDAMLPAPGHMFVAQPHFLVNSHC